MIMRKVWFVFPILLLFYFNLQGQDGYGTAVGVRLGVPLSASIKHFINDRHAVEAYVGTRGNNQYRATNLSGAYLVHNPINELEGLTWYYGGGASVFFWKWRDSFLNPENFGTTNFGIQGYIGLDYQFSQAPISLTVDWVPTYFISGFGSGLGGGYGAFAVRYILR